MIIFFRGKVEEEEVTKWKSVQPDDDKYKELSKEKTLLKSKPMNVAAVNLFSSFFSLSN
jgi:hypothetical protein